MKRLEQLPLPNSIFRVEKTFKTASGDGAYDVQYQRHAFPDDSVTWYQESYNDRNELELTLIDNSNEIETLNKDFKVTTSSPSERIANPARLESLTWWNQLDQDTVDYAIGRLTDNSATVKKIRQLYDYLEAFRMKELLSNISTITARKLVLRQMIISGINIHKL